MGLEIIIFVGAILFGILLYWRESNGNGVYRFLNKIVNSKELQMKPGDKTGFIYQQKLLLRIVYITAFFIILAVVVQFFTPFKIFGSYNGTSAFASMIVGTLIGSYIASFVIKSGEVIEDKTGDLGGIVKDVVEKGKEIVEDVKEKASDLVDDVKGESETIEDEVVEDKPEAKEDDGKTARERLKDKGLL
ncbi:hypothetical protein RM697_09005 [Ichthyenterobacterium sp. W332]|uniref:Uncharacterized protein n=1 Tax=Microcosmobacter mediterraneus TaxID=3075607 RepID=A0ABU2YKT9_9FLAO|nr:hypothetical protein [Ichthyenterobacterium sp. W332]MDT0558785.1 hypothetical protein [Ichthyenterobacterium sp. W332]